MNNYFAKLYASLVARFTKPQQPVYKVKHDHSQFEKVKFVNSKD